jgi:hypothetical protein
LAPQAATLISISMMMKIVRFIIWC